MSNDCISGSDSFRYDGGQEIGALENVISACVNRVLIDSLHKAPVTPSRLTLLYIED